MNDSLPLGCMEDLDSSLHMLGCNVETIKTVEICAQQIHEDFFYVLCKCMHMLAHTHVNTHTHTHTRTRVHTHTNSCTHFYTRIVAFLQKTDPSAADPCSRATKSGKAKSGKEVRGGLWCREALPDSDAGIRGHFSASATPASQVCGQGHGSGGYSVVVSVR